MMHSPSKKLSSRKEFEKQLAFGQIAETDIARWAISRGSYVLPVYDVEIESGKGPRVFGPGAEIVAPDLLVVSKDKKAVWVEAKHKTVFTWHRITSQWTTGIDRNHYREYLKVAEVIDWPLWLMFLHKESEPDPRDVGHGCPKECPVGLFGGEIGELKDAVNHEHENWGRHGMVYWAHGKLKRLAALDEFNRAIGRM